MSDKFDANLDQDTPIDLPQGSNPPRLQSFSNQNLQKKSQESNESLEMAAANYSLAHAAHPCACVATFAFKALAFFFFFFVGYFMSDVLTFILVLTFSAIDFWTVKNITGRLLVSLRWWSDYDEKGNEIWKFESYNKQFKANVVDTAFFWTAQITSTVCWAIVLLIQILTLSPFWALLVFINFSLCAVNLYGYYKCRGDHEKKLNNFKQSKLPKIIGKLFQ